MCLQMFFGRIYRELGCSGFAARKGTFSVTMTGSDVVLHFTFEDLVLAVMERASKNLVVVPFVSIQMVFTSKAIIVTVTSLDWARVAGSLRVLGSLMTLFIVFVLFVFLAFLLFVLLPFLFLLFFPMARTLVVLIRIRLRTVIGAAPFMMFLFRFQFPLQRILFRFQLQRRFVVRFGTGRRNVE